MRSRTAVADNIIALELVSGDAEPLPRFEAGAHIDVRTKSGLIRQYSLCNSPAVHDHYRLAVVLDPISRGGSITVHNEFVENSIVEIGVLRNHFPLDATATESLLFGGGIDITPIRAMAYSFAEQGSAYSLHYCVRERSRAAFFQHRSLLLAIVVRADRRGCLRSHPRQQDLAVALIVSMDWLVAPRGDRKNMRPNTFHLKQS